MSNTRVERRYQINDAIDRWVYDHPDQANLHDPDNVKELSRYLRDCGFVVASDNGDQDTNNHRL